MVKYFELSNRCRTLLLHLLRTLPRNFPRAICLALAGIAVMSLAGLAAPAQAATRYEAGISTSATLLRMDDAALNARLDDIKNMGAIWVRVDFSWAVVQPSGPAEFDWSLFDRVVREAGNHHLKVLAVLAYTPKWAQEPRCAALAASDVAAQKCNPRNPNEFAHFAAVAAFRYQHQPIRAWEIWNEPNLSGYWKTAQPDNQLYVDPVTYARVANAAAAQIRYHDPDSVIVTGGLAPRFEPAYPIGMRQSDYLRLLLPHLNRKMFDAVGIHPYSWPVLPDKAAIYNAFYTVDAGRRDLDLRAIMTAAGWGGKEIWGTEFGASTLGKRIVGRQSATNRPDHVTEDMQAQIVQHGVQAWYKKLNVGPLFVQSDSDRWLIKVVAKKNDAGFGLRRANDSEKPAYAAFKNATAQLEYQKNAQLAKTTR